MKYPGELNALINKAKRELVDAGNSADEAERMALHQARVAGWYETLDGWKRIASDLRSKINIRKAHRQPDGRYLIQDVDVFYPNAVKGKPIHDEDGNVVGHETITYNADDVRKIIDNTQLGVEDGNPVPLTPTHVRPEHKYTGIVIPAIGKGINFRESPRGDGWARCDLADVEEKTVDDWRRGRITGLSAGISLR